MSRAPILPGLFVVSLPMATILVTGGSGLIGRRLSEKLISEGHAVRWLSRTPGTLDGVTAYAWDPVRDRVDEAALKGVEGIVHLAGAGIADKRWTEVRVEELIASRAGTARLLHRACVANGTAPRCFVSAAGVGYYGAVTSDHRFSESDPHGQDTIARISLEWETAVDEWSATCRVVKLRTPLVLAAEGGALPRLARIARLGLASPLGAGLQHMPWVHIDDLVSAYALALTYETMSGAYNIRGGCSTNADMMRAIARAVERPFMAPRVPAFLLRLVLGDLSQVLLEGSDVDDKRLRDAGFSYAFENLEVSLRALMRR